MNNRPEIVNSNDRNIWKHAYKLGNEFSAFIVYADNEQDAFDEWADYCRDCSYEGYFIDEQDIFDSPEDYPEDSYIRAGNESRAMYSHYLWIKQIR